MYLVFGAKFVTWKTGASCCVKLNSRYSWIKLNISRWNDWRSPPASPGLHSTRMVLNVSLLAEQARSWPGGPGQWESDRWANDVLMLIMVLVMIIVMVRMITHTCTPLSYYNKAPHRLFELENNSSRHTRINIHFHRQLYTSVHSNPCSELMPSFLSDHETDKTFLL